MKLLILIPAYNEEETITDVIQETRKNFPDADICVVNDGSEDKTGAILKEDPDIISLHLPYNMGIGGALWTGFNYFCQKDYEFLLRLDSDGQHPPSEAAKLLEPLTQGEADLVIGSRFITRTGYLSSQLRRSGIRLLNMLTTIILKNKITD
ncbi:glycosyltransferase family 2 protein, partial [Acidobacteriota bacterium]